MKARFNKILPIIAAALIAPAAQARLSSAAMSLLDSADPAVISAPALDASQNRIRAFVTYSNAAVLDSIEALGCRVIPGAVSGVATVSLPPNLLETVGNMEGVDYLEAGQQPRLLVNSIRSQSGVDLVHSGKVGGQTAPYTGTGVIVGIIDTGLEYNHLAFRNADGTGLRITRVWDQNGIGRSPEKFGYGAEYDTPEQIIGAVCDNRATYHATHVAGIAAGSTANSRYYGMAPDAEIVFVSFGSEMADISNAITYIFDYADEVGKPCVINMSLGNHQGPHDGTSTLDRSIDALAGPGRIIVGAAGNEGEAAMHASKELTADDTTMKTMLAYSTQSAMSKTGVDIWGEEGHDLSVSVAVVNPLKGNIIEQTEEVVAANGSRQVFFFDYETTGVEATVVIYPACTAEGRPNIYLETGAETMAGNRKLAVIAKGSASQTLHAWNVGAESFTDGGRSGWTDGEQACSVGEIGGTANRIISVGAYNSCNALYPYFDPGYVYTYDFVKPNEVSAFSSYGPTADGRMKPDVIAGGMIVVSSVSQYASTDFDPAECIDRTYDPANKAYYYGTDAGTSMSSPAVAGMVALWLEANPDLTPEEVRETLRLTSKADSFTGAVPNNHAGNGKVSASDGLHYILTGESSLANLSAATKSRVWTRDGELSVVSAADGLLRVTALSGATVCTRAIAAGYSSMSLSLPRGIYIVTLPDGTTAKLAL